MIEGVINELSGLMPPQFQVPVAASAADARQLMSRFVTCISEGFRQKYLTALRTAETFSLFDLAVGYSIENWRNDRAANRDERTLFRSFTTAFPYLNTPVEEVTYQGIRAAGFSSCVITNSLAVSWASQPIWEQTAISVEMLRLTVGGELLSTEITVRNASSSDHWRTHAEWIRNTYASTIGTGQELLDRASRMLPHLAFGPLAIKQLRGLSGNEISFPWIIQALLSAETEMLQWKDGAFPHNRLPGPASGESWTVHNEKKLRDKRVFQTDDGSWEFMEHHMKQIGQNQRVHYWVDGINRRMVIGYVGEHLETARY
jgi:hypothetical protein